MCGSGSKFELQTLYTIRIKQNIYMPISNNIQSLIIELLIINVIYTANSLYFKCLCK